MNKLTATVLLACSVAFAGNTKRPIDVWRGGGVFTQVVDGAEWKTSFYFHNMDTIALYGMILFADDKGNDMSMPSSSPDTYWEFTLPPGGTTSYETPGTGNLQQGSALVVTCDRPCLQSGSTVIRGRLGALAVFRWRAAGRQEVEAVVPLETPDISAHVLFDNRQSYSTGFALMNADTASDTVSITVRDSSGTMLTQENLVLGSWEKKVFMVADRYPMAAGKQGCIEISGKAVVALGLRASPNGALSSSHSMISVP